MSIKSKVIIVAIIFIAGMATGYFLMPSKIQVKVEEKVVEKEVIKEVAREKRSVKNNKIKVIVETKWPDGTITKETKIVDRGTIELDHSRHKDVIAHKEKEKTTEEKIIREKADWNISILGGHNLSNALQFNSLTYGGHVQRRILGPIHVGGFGLTNQTLGVSLGVSF